MYILRMHSCAWGYLEILCNVNVYASHALMEIIDLGLLCDVNVYSSHAFMCVGYLELLCDANVYAAHGLPKAIV